MNGKEIKLKVNLTVWNVENMTGYKPITTFWSDFCIAEAFGNKGINDTYMLAFEGWKNNYKYLTELAMVLNHKCGYWYEKNNDFSRLYCDLYNKVDEWACNNLKKEEASYYYRTLD